MLLLNLERHCLPLKAIPIYGHHHIYVSIMQVLVQIEMLLIVPRLQRNFECDTDMRHAKKEVICLRNHSLRNPGQSAHCQY